MITILTKTDCIMFNLGDPAIEQHFRDIFYAVKTLKVEKPKSILIMNSSVGRVEVIPAESEIMYEDRKYIEADGEAIEVLTNQVSRG